MAVDLAKAHKNLQARKAAVETQSDKTSGDRAAVVLDQTSVGRLSRMDAMQQQAMATAQERSRMNELVRIEQAMRRISDDEYGYCITCGKEIAQGRLDADPAAPQCVTCASR